MMNNGVKEMKIGKNFHRIILAIMVMMFVILIPATSVFSMDSTPPATPIPIMPLNGTEEDLRLLSSGAR
jgi:hypothetical protein